MNKFITVIEFPKFLAQVGEIISGDERDEFVTYIAQNPEDGSVIPGTGGIRKIRWGGKHKGKRGGVRIIYYFYNKTSPIFLLTMFGKNEKEDLTSDQKKQMMTLASILKSECKSLGGFNHE